jgi:hypothetical protein
MSRRVTSAFCSTLGNQHLQLYKSQEVKFYEVPAQIKSKAVILHDFFLNNKIDLMFETIETLATAKVKTLSHETLQCEYPSYVVILV